MKLKVSLLAVLVSISLALAASPVLASGDSDGDSRHSRRGRLGGHGNWGGGQGSWDPCSSQLATYLSWCGGDRPEQPSSSVPEPGSALVFGAGMLIVGQHLRRRNGR